MRWRSETRHFFLSFLLKTLFLNISKKKIKLFHDFIRKWSVWDHWGKISTEDDGTETRQSQQVSLTHLVIPPPTSRPDVESRHFDKNLKSEQRLTAATRWKEEELQELLPWTKPLALKRRRGERMRWETPPRPPAGPEVNNVQSPAPPRQDEGPFRKTKSGKRLKTIQDKVVGELEK